MHNLPRLSFTALLTAFTTVLIIVPSVRAEPIAVSTIQIREQSSYLIERTYAGQLIPRRESHMGFESGGVISQVHVEEGDTVTAGQTLVTLDQASISVEIEGALARAATARAHLNASKAQLELSRLTLTRHQSLADNGHVSSQRLDELVQQHRINEANLLVAQTQLSAANAATNKIRVNFDKTILRAPYAGTIQSRWMDEGSIVNPGTRVISLIERGFIEARIGIPESMLHLLGRDRSYEFIVNTRSVPGKLKTVLPQVDESTGTVTSIFSLDSTSLYAGSLAELQLDVRISETGYWMPLTAIAESQRGLWSVLVVVDSEAQLTNDPTTVETRLIEIIHHGRDAVFVRGTLQDGDLVVDNGVGRIVPGQSVSLASRNANQLVPAIAE